MKILLRLKIMQNVVSILETENSIEVEVHPNSNEQHKQKMINYLEEEGILDEVLVGNINFATPITNQNESDKEDKKI